jgi:hypothetical protein
MNGEMVGRKVALIVEDYEFKTAVALTKTKKLVERDGVPIVTDSTRQRQGPQYPETSTSL